MHAIRFDHLTKRYGSRLALDAVSFEARPGRVTGFLGRNGAGKTTALRILLALTAPTTGSATIGGLPYADIRDPGHHIGALVDGAGFHPGTTVRRGLALLGRSVGVPARRADDVLAMTDLAHVAGQRAGRLSLGMRQRLALAAVLLSDPSVLILDEPANGLDPQGLRWLRDLLRSLAAEGRTVLVSSHQLNEVDLVADDVVVLHGGRVALAGPVTDLTRPCVVARSPCAATLASALARRGFDVDVDGDRLRVPGTTTDVVGDVAAAARVRLHELRYQTSSVEELFFASIDGGRAAA